MNNLADTADASTRRRHETTPRSAHIRRRRERGRSDRRRRPSHAGGHVSPASTSGPARSCSSNARTSSAPAPSSSAAPTTRCHASPPTKRAAASSRSRPAITRRRSRWPASVLDIPRVIVMPSDAPAVKRIATERLWRRSRALRSRPRGSRSDRPPPRHDRGLTLIPPYDHPHVIAGQGTAARELFEDVGPLDFLFVPCGGGGLLSGSAHRRARDVARMSR